MPKPLPNWETLTPDDARPFGEIRLIAADLDGTLVRTGSSEIFGVIAKLRRSLAHPRYGVAFTIATGRAMAGVNYLVRGIGIAASVPLVLYNGSVVAENLTGKLLHHPVINHDVVRRVVSALEKLSVTILTYHLAYTTSSIFTSDNAIFTEVVFGWSKTDFMEHEFNGLTVKWMKTWSEIPQFDASAILVLVDSTNMLMAVDAAIKQIPGLSITLSGGQHLEIRPAGSNKAQGLAVAAKALGISREEVLALGDNDNDADMLSWAGIGVSIGNASELAQQCSDYQCRYDVEQGAIEVLRLVRQARRYFHEPQHERKRGAK